VMSKARYCGFGKVVVSEERLSAFSFVWRQLNSVSKNVHQNPCLKIACRTGFETAVWISLPKNCGLKNSPELNPVDYHVWGNFRDWSQVRSKPEDIAEL